jgi:hypothetical protein
MDNETPPLPEQPPDEEAQPQPPSPPREPRRGGRARERYERRKHHAAPAEPPKVLAERRQPRAARQIKVPAVVFPRGSRVLIGVVGAVLFVAILVIVLGRVRNNAPTTQPNGVWLGTEWTFADHTDAEMTQLAQDLRGDRIGTVYAWVTTLQSDNSWRDEDKFDKVKTFVQQFKKAYPEAILYGWVSIPSENPPGTTRLSDVPLQQQVADFSKRILDEFGFDGVFINAYPVWDDDQNFLALLRAVRLSVGIDARVSAAIPPDWSPSTSGVPQPPLIAAGTEWKKI